MSEITDLGSPDRELSTRDITRKKDKLTRVNKKLKKTNLSAKKLHNLNFKKRKTEDQIETGMSGIRPVKRAFKLSHQYDLQQEEKFNKRNK